MTPAQEYLLARDMWSSVAVDSFLFKTPKIETIGDRMILGNRIRALERLLTPEDLPYLEERLTPYVYSLVYRRLTKIQKPPEKVRECTPWDA